MTLQRLMLLVLVPARVLLLLPPSQRPLLAPLLALAPFLVPLQSKGWLAG